MTSPTQLHLDLAPTPAPAAQPLPAWAVTDSGPDQHPVRDDGRPYFTHPDQEDTDQ